MIVLDASAAAHMVRKTPEGKALSSFMEPDEDVWAPQLFQSEVLSVFWKYVHAGMFTHEEAATHLDAALAYITHFVNMLDLLPAVLSTAARLDRSPSGMQYLVLAKLTDGTVYSLDDKLLALCDVEGVQHIEKIAF